MKKILAIAMLTALEALRSKILAVFALFAAVILLGSQFFGTMSLGEQAKIFKDMALGIMSLFLSLLAIVLPVELLLRDREQNRLGVLLSKPILRAGYLAGKALGFFAVLLAANAAMTALALLLLQLRHMPWDINMLKAAVLIACQSCVLSVLATGLGTLFSSHALALLCGVCLYLAGHLLEPLLQWAERAPGVAAKAAALLLLYLLPHLENFNVQNAVALGDAVAWSYVLQNIGYALAYGAAVFALTALAFQRKDF